MKKQLRQIIIMIFVVTILIIGNNCNAIELEVKEYSKAYKKWLELPEEEKANSIEPSKYTIDISDNNVEESKQQLYSIANARLLGTNIDSKFDLRDKISIKLKNQQQTSECWAFAATTVLETNVALAQNKTDIEYSPRHMDYATSLTFLDGQNPNGHNREVGSGNFIKSGGGNIFIALAYITSGRGPVLEEDMPFINSEDKINLSEIEGKQIQLKVNETIHFPNIYKTKENGEIKYTNGDDKEYTQAEIKSFRDDIKEHIKKYGAVIAETYTEGHKYYSNTKEDWRTSKAYNCDNAEEKSSHQVTIIGWDDNYAVTNFNEEHRPQNPGAYIIQNSYGSEIEVSEGNIIPVFDNGYIYISYEDVLIERNMVGIIETSDVDYDNIYQYNPLGFNKKIGSKGQDSVYLANVYTKGEQKEYLKEIAVQADKGDKYEVYVNSKNDELAVNNFEKITTVEIEKTGYCTIKLDKIVELTGEKFVVCLKKTNEEIDNNFWIECKDTFSYTSDYNTASSNDGEAFFSTDMLNWTDLNKANILGISDISLTIKAFTTENTEDKEVFEPEVKITSDKYKIDDENKTCIISPDITVSTFKTNINSEVISNIVNNKGEQIAETDFVGTGAIINLTNNTQYTLIVIGDVNGDGKITTTDITKLKRRIVGLDKLETIYEKAGDINESATITATDLLKIKKVLIGLEKL